MAPSIRIPDGSVFFGWADGLAGELLAAADEVGADRKTAVRRVTGGYHVLLEVAEHYVGGLREITLEAGNGEPVEIEGNPVDGLPEGGEGSEILAPLPVTADSAHAEIDEYAATLTPPVEFPAAISRKQKIELLEAARQPKPAE